MTERLARVAAGDDVDRLDHGPVDLRDVAEVHDAGMMGGEHLACGWLDLREPGEIPADDRLHRDVQPAVSGEEGADARHEATCPARDSTFWMSEPLTPSLQPIACADS